MYSALVCPACLSDLDERPDDLYCETCDLEHPVVDGIVDCSCGQAIDDFDDSTSLTQAHRAALQREVDGASWRIKGYFGPRLATLAARLGRPLRVLDVGCGNGLSIDLLEAAGHEAWGVDLSRLRRWQWIQQRKGGGLLLADAGRLPFRSGSFDVILSSGMLEHIGITEERCDGRYFVSPRSDRDDARRQVLGEMLRVIDSTGRIWLDLPNGAFPVDFWHTDDGAAARLHRLDEGFLPTVGELRGYLCDLDPGSHLTSLPPADRLRFRQVGRRWYGRALATPMRGFLSLAGLPGFRWLGLSALNPYLVLEIRPSGICGHKRRSPL